MEWLELDARLEEKKNAIVRRQRREARRRKKEEAERQRELDKLAARCREMEAEDALSMQLAAWFRDHEERKIAEKKREEEMRLFRQIAEVCRRAKTLGVQLSTTGVDPSERLRILCERIETKKASLERSNAAKQRLDELPRKRSKTKQLMQRFFASNTRKKMEKAVYNRNCDHFLPLLEPVNSLAKNGDVEMLNHESENGLTPVIAAVFTCSLTVLRRLLQLGASPDWETQAGMTPLLAAIMTNDLVAISILIEFHVNLTYEAKGGLTPLLLAADKGRLEALRVLLNNGAPVNQTNAQSRSPLVQAVISGHHDIVRVLLTHNASKDLRDSSGRTALEWAERMKYAAIALLLDGSVSVSSLKAQVAAEDEAEDTQVQTIDSSNRANRVARHELLDKLMKEQDVVKVRELLAVKDDILSPNHESLTGMTPLLLFSLHGTHVDVLFGLEHKCISTHQNRDGVTPLMLASKRGDTAMIAMLLKAGCHMLTRDFNGRDSFHYLCVNDHPALAEQFTKIHRETSSKTPPVILGTPLFSFDMFRVDGEVSKAHSGPASDSREHSSTSLESSRSQQSEDTMSEHPDNLDPLDDPNIRRWRTHQRVLKGNRHKREAFDAERSKILAASAKGRRNGLVAPLPDNPNGRWKFPKCNNCKQSKATKRCLNCEQVLCDKCHARLHEIAHRRHHCYEQVNPTLCIGDKPKQEVELTRENSVEAAVLRSRELISSLRGVLEGEVADSLQNSMSTDIEVDKYKLKRRVEKEKKVMEMKINVPVEAAKRVVTTDEDKIFSQPAELELASLYFIQKKYDKARGFLLKAKSIVEESMGVMHPTMLKITVSIANISHVTGNSESCIKTLEEAIVLFESVLMPDHPDLIDAVVLLLTSLDSLNRYEDAVKICRRALDRCRFILPASHNLVVTLNDRFDNLLAKRESVEMLNQDELLLRQLRDASEASQAKTRAYEAYELALCHIGDNFRSLLLGESKDTESFMEFARKEFALDLVQFWVAVEQCTQETSDSKAFRARAVQIYITYIKSRRVKVITAVQRKRIKRAITSPDKKLPTTVFDDTQSVTFEVIFNRIYSRFLESTVARHEPATCGI